MRVVREPTAHLGCVVAQEVDRLTHFSDGVGQRLARLADDQPHQVLHLAFHQVGGAIEQRGARLRRRGLPDRRGSSCGSECGINVGLGGFGHMANDIAQVRRVAHRLGCAAHVRCVTDRRLGSPDRAGASKKGGRQRRQALLVRQVNARRVCANVTVEVARQRNFRMRHTERPFIGVHLFHHRHRIGDEVVQRNRLVRNAVHERGVGAVFQQTAHQVSQECFVRTDRGVDAARAVQLAGLVADDLLVQRLAHAVQALEFVLARVIVLAGHLVDRGQRVRVVRGELREDRFRRRQQLSRARQVRHIRVDLARVDRVALQAFHLGALDLAVPVGALHQADHQAVLAAAGQIDDEVEHERAALLIALHHEADAVPAGQFGRKAQALQQIERQLQAVGLFRIDVDADVVFTRQHRQRLHARVQLVDGAVVLRAGIARMQRRQLDGDARPFVDATSARGLPDRADGLFVRREIALGVFLRHGGLAEHVVGIAEAFGLELARVGQRFGNGLAGDELLAHQAHRHVHALADQRLATLADDARKRLRQPGFVVRGHQLAREQQAPRGGVHEERRALAQVRVPVAVADLVADECIARGLVGNAQQRFGQAHQRHAFLARQGEFLNQALHQPLAARAGLLCAQLAGEVAGELLGFRGERTRQAGLLQQHRNGFGFWPAVCGRDGSAQHRLRLHALCEFEERLHRGRSVVTHALVHVRDGCGGGREAIRRRAVCVSWQLPPLHLIQIREDRLLDQPMRRAVNGLCDALEAFTRSIVQLDPEGGCSHVGSYP